MSKRRILTWWGFCAAGVGAALFVRLLSADAPWATDQQLRQARINLERVQLHAKGRSDYRSARGAVWALLTYAELRGAAPRSRLPQPTRAALAEAWAEMERRAHFEDERL